MKRTHLYLIGLLGPAAALLVTWLSALLIANLPAGNAPEPQIVQGLRSSPDDSRLLELAAIGVGYPRFNQLPATEVIAGAEQLLAGGYKPPGAATAIRVPFEPGPYLIGSSTWHLSLHSFWAPALLARAYEISHEGRYIDAAAQYIVDWDRYERSLRVPRGFFFNDHAMAARTIVVGEVWRLYRGSEGYRPALATALLHYVQKLSRLLMEPRLYEYRSNHGIMQCLALMHLASAFPLLDGADELFETGRQRLQRQAAYFVNTEGVILEHSAGYDLDGVRSIAAAGRYLGMHGDALPEELSRRYRKAVQFVAALRRPDDSLPPVGDTRERDFFPLLVADFDAQGIVSAPLRAATATELKPSPLTLAPGAGYAVLWQGLEHWPAGELNQTVFHWGNFATQIHKHADELGISLWANGVQWVRGIGYWPFVASRSGAMGWQSSNAPHWLGESAGAARSSSLQAWTGDSHLPLFDVLRMNADGRSVRRQLMRPDPATWVVLDSFAAPGEAKTQTLWRFSPQLTLRQSSPTHLIVAAKKQNMHVLVHGSGALTLDADPDGRQPWNKGVMDGGKIVPSPAARIQGAGAGAILTVLSLQDANTDSPALESIALQWKDPADWNAELRYSGRDAVRIARQGAMLTASGLPGTQTAELRLKETPEDGRGGMQDALDAYQQERDRYGTPFEVRFERRVKVTVAVLLALVLQTVVFIAVARRRRRWLAPLLAGTLAAWLCLCLFLHLRFLA